MSRSIHETRASVRAIRKWRYEDAEDRRADYRVALERLRQKRRIRQQVAAERRSEELVLDGARPESVPIDVECIVPELNHGVVPSDLHAVMARLPGDAWHGLASIRLCLGRERMEDYAARRMAAGEVETEVERDPICQRRGSEICPGVFAGSLLGTYWFDHRIELYGYVVTDSRNVPEVLQLQLKLRALRTFVHELAHRRDHAVRTGRGRWRMDQDARDEAFAERWEEEWYETVVVPYVVETQAHLGAAVSRWLEELTGERLELSELIEFGMGDGGCFDGFYDVFVEEGAGRESLRCFAVFLVRDMRFRSARRVFERMVHEDRSDTATRLLLLECHLRAGEPELALETMGTLVEDPGTTEGAHAWSLLMLQLEFLAMVGEWSELRHRARAAEATHGEDRWRIRSVRRWLMLAAAQQGDGAEVDRVLAEDPEIQWWGRAGGREVRAYAALAGGDAVDALRRLAECESWLATALGFVAAVRLGDAAEAVHRAAAIELAKDGYSALDLTLFRPLLHKWLPEAIAAYEATRRRE